MSFNKKIAIVGLLLLNLFFVLGTVTAKTQSANAQSRYAPTDYQMVGYTYSEDIQAVVIFDLRAGKFLVMKWSTNAKRMVTVGLRNVAKDFKKKAR